MQLKKLIKQAVDFHQSGSTEPANSTAVPLCFGSVTEACEVLTGVVTFEAQQGLASPLRNPPASDKLRRHRIRAALDLDGANPGIWTRDGIVTLSDPHQGESVTPKPKRRVNPETEAKRALNKVNRLKQQKEKFEESKEANAQKRKEKSLKKKEACQEDLEDEHQAGTDELSEKENALQPPTDTNECELVVESPAKTPSIPVSAPMTPLMAWKRWRRCYTASHPRANSLHIDNEVPQTPTIVARHKLYESPLNYVRDIDALHRCGIHPALRAPLLNCSIEETNHIVGTDGLRIVHGPPGTGKTFTILEELRMLHNLPGTGPSALRRVLITAPTNQAVDELARRAMSFDLFSSQSRRKKIVIWTTPEGQSNGFGGGESPSNIKGSVWVFSTVSSRNSRFLIDTNFDVVVVDEAGLVPEPSIWGLLRDSTRRLVLVGDYKQLRCMSSQAGKQLQHDRSTMERLISNNYPYEFLNHQHRMVPSIAAFVSAHFYANKLFNGSNAPSSVLSQALCIAPIPSQENAEIVGTSWRNRTDAVISVKEAKQLRLELSNAGISGSVAILVPYTAQLECIQQILDNEPEDLVAMTIDSAQGREFDGVILSTVRTGKAMGFWECDARVLVALTRGKYGLRIVGSKESWMQWGGVWGHITRL